MIASFECRIQQPESKRIACLLAMLFYPARLVDARYNQIQNYLGSALDILLRAMICKYVCETKELLGMCLRGKKIAPLWHKGRAEQGTHAKGVQFFCPSSTYPAIILLVLHFIAQLWSNFHCQRPEDDTFYCTPLAHMLKGYNVNSSTIAKGVQ